MRGDGGRRRGGYLQGRGRQGAVCQGAQALGRVAEEGQSVRDGVEGGGGQILIQRVRQTDGLRGRGGGGRRGAAGCRGERWDGGHGEKRFVDPQTLLRNKKEQEEPLKPKLFLMNL